jgi:type IV secretory pathway TraG/TraD family ATPase VirD4
MSKDKNSDDMMIPIAILLGICLALNLAYKFFLYTIIPIAVRFYFYHYLLFILSISLMTTFVFVAIAAGISNLFRSLRPKAALSSAEPAVGVGQCVKTKKQIFLSTASRALHTGVIGTTGCGKTESVIVPWSVDDIKNGRGLVMIDGKADRTLLDKLYAYAAKYNRTKDFRVFSLFDPGISGTYNPLLGGSAEEVAERVFNSFEFENEFYAKVQLDWFVHTLRIFEKAGLKPTFLRVSQSLSDPRVILKLADLTGDADLQFWAKQLCSRPAAEVVSDVKGLLVNVNRFAYGQFASQFNSDNPSISISQAMKENLIVYFQLPALQFENLGKSTGRIVIQDLMSQIANRHKGKTKDHRFFSIYLDDFAEYLHENFVTVLNKSRSAKVGCVFAHQAMGDIQALGDAVCNSIMTNTNIKILMRCNEPETADYLSRMIGTKTTEKTTERRRASFLTNGNTGDMSVRTAEEFMQHPRVFKNELMPGEAVLVTPEITGLKVKLNWLPDLEVIDIPVVEKVAPKGIDKKSLRIEDKLPETKPETSARPIVADQAQAKGSLLAEENQTNGGKYAS